MLPHITGRRIVRAVVRHHGLRWPVDPALPALLAGLTVTRLLRRGKYLLIECMPDAGRADTAGGWLLIHLGMTGTLRVLE
ncbi:DNA-formamidopyrimidine glycosylase family protein, partial [Photobacterium swingsii]|uniref:DNA-formamidopyrimidine glycosylase family protein n=1 Tax=Photobacterium swingsii TaxID=680026 RepID=UPI0040681986